MTRKRAIKLLMGREKFSRNAARILCKCNANSMPYDELYRAASSWVARYVVGDYAVIHITRMPAKGVHIDP